MATLRSVTPEDPVLTTAAIRFARDIQYATFLRKAGAAGVNFRDVHSGGNPIYHELLQEGVQCFTDTQKRSCLIYNARELQPLANMLPLLRSPYSIEHYRGPAYPSDDATQAVTIGGISAHRPQAFIVRC